MKPRLADPDHRPVKDTAQRIDAGVVKTGHHNRIDIRVPPRHLEQPLLAARDIKETLDAFGAAVGLGGDDLGARPRHPAGGKGAWYDVAPLRGYVDTADERIYAAASARLWADARRCGCSSSGARLLDTHDS